MRIWICRWLGASQRHFFFIFFIFYILILDQPPPQTELDNIFDNLPMLSAPKKAELEDELTCYLTASTVATNNPLQWWVEQTSTFPCLSRMALSYLSIPGRAGLVGPVFTIIGLLVTVF